VWFVAFFLLQSLDFSIVGAVGDCYWVDLQCILEVLVCGLCGFTCFIENPMDYVVEFSNESDVVLIALLCKKNCLRNTNIVCDLDTIQFGLRVNAMKTVRNFGNTSLCIWACRHGVGLVIKHTPSPKS